MAHYSCNSISSSEKGEIVKCHGSIGEKGESEAKASAALKSHSESERRRRKRINGHLATLRCLVPSTEKMDKAALLAEVVRQLKALKKNAVEASQGFLVPSDADEVKVEAYHDDEGEGWTSYRASVCCDYQPEILSDLRHSLESLQLQLVRAEISTLGHRVKNEFVYNCCERRNNVNKEECQILASNVHQVLSSVMQKASSSQEYSLNMPLMSKRQKDVLH